jgi:hypothetical protein
MRKDIDGTKRAPVRSRLLPANPDSGRLALTENRHTPRHRVLKGAFIATGEKAPKLECTVRNISDTGAAIQVSTTFGLPQTFDLIVDGVRHRCRVMWRTDTKIGVSFES